eukprot:g27374.t2
MAGIEPRFDLVLQEMKRGTGVEVGCQKAMEKPMADMEEIRSCVKEAIGTESEMRRLQVEALEAKAEVSRCQQELEQMRHKFNSEASQTRCLGRSGKPMLKRSNNWESRGNTSRAPARYEAPPAAVKANWLNRQGFFGKQALDEDALEMLGSLPDDRAMAVLEQLEQKAGQGEIWNPNSYVVKAVIRHNNQLRNEANDYAHGGHGGGQAPAALPVLKKVNWLNREGFFGKNTVDEDAIEMLGQLPEKAKSGEIWNPNSYVVRAVVRHSQNMKNHSWNDWSDDRSSTPLARRKGGMRPQKGKGKGKGGTQLAIRTETRSKGKGKSRWLKEAEGELNDVKGVLEESHQRGGLRFLQQARPERRFRVSRASGSEHCKAKGGGGTDYPEYAVLSRSSEALCCAVDALLTALAFASPEDVGARWREASEKVLLQHKARLNELSASDPRQWNEEFEAEDQLFEFTGLSQDLDRWPRSQRWSQRFHRKRSRGVLASLSFYRAGPSGSTSSASAEDLLDMEGEPEPVAWASRSPASPVSGTAPSDLLDLQSDLIDVSSPLSSPAAGTGAAGTGADADVPVEARG